MEPSMEPTAHVWIITSLFGLLLSQLAQIKRTFRFIFKFFFIVLRLGFLLSFGSLFLLSHAFFCNEGTATDHVSAIIAAWGVGRQMKRNAKGDRFFSVSLWLAGQVVSSRGRTPISPGPLLCSSSGRSRCEPDVGSTTQQRLFLRHRQRRAHPRRPIDRRLWYDLYFPVVSFIVSPFFY